MKYRISDERLSEFNANVCEPNNPADLVICTLIADLREARAEVERLRKAYSSLESALENDCTCSIRETWGYD